MKIEFKLTHTIYEIDKLETIALPQIPVAGRSNVGKSSFINCLSGKKDLAKTSSKPGKTRSVNFYLLNRPKGYLVDLPGYGYAKTSKKEREKWARLVSSYFEQNIPYIRGVILLIDSRIPPQETDVMLYNYLKEKGCTIIPILTKCDRAKMAERTRSKNFWKEYSPSWQPPILFSAKTSTGKSEVFKTIKNLFFIQEKDGHQKNLF